MSLPLVFPLLIEWLVLRLKVERHIPEASSLEVEVEVLVVLMLLLGLLLFFMRRSTLRFLAALDSQLTAL